MSFLPTYLKAAPILGSVTMNGSSTGDYPIGGAGVDKNYSYVHVTGIRDDRTGATLPVRSSFPTVELASNTIVTVTREDNNGDIMIVDFEILQVRSIFLRQAIQRGLVTIGAGANNGTVGGLVAVGANAYIIPCGWRGNSGADFAVGDYSAKLSMPSTSSIKAELYSPNLAIVTLSYAYQIIDPRT